MMEQSESEPRAQVHWYLPADLVDRLRALAKKEHRPIRSQATVLLEQGLAMAEGRGRALDRQREAASA